MYFILLKTSHELSIISVFWLTGECSYVQCKPEQWGQWDAQCGKATRSRKITEVKATIKKSSCADLLRSCPSDVEEESRETLCKFIGC